MHYIDNPQEYSDLKETIHIEVLSSEVEFLKIKRTFKRKKYSNIYYTKRNTDNKRFILILITTLPMLTQVQSSQSLI